MKEEPTLNDTLLEILQKENFSFSEIVELLRFSIEPVSDEFYEKLKEKSIKLYIDDAYTLDEGARIKRLKDNRKKFLSITEYLLDLYGPDIKNTQPFRNFRDNVAAGIGKRIKLLEGF